MLKSCTYKQRSMRQRNRDKQGEIDKERLRKQDREKYKNKIENKTYYFMVK